MDFSGLCVICHALLVVVRQACRTSMTMTTYRDLPNAFDEIGEHASRALFIESEVFGVEREVCTCLVGDHDAVRRSLCTLGCHDNGLTRGHRDREGRRSLRHRSNLSERHGNDDQCKLLDSGKKDFLKSPSEVVGMDSRKKEVRVERK